MKAKNNGSEALGSTISRRELFRLAGVGAFALATSRLTGLGRRATRSHNAQPNLIINLRAHPDTVQLFPGPATNVWRFSGEVVHGDPSRLQYLPGSYLGPTIRLRRGERVKIHFENQIIEPTIVHWHGLNVPDEMDGHPMFAIETGQSYLYEYRPINNAGTYWYHPHPDMMTGGQVFAGMAGLIVLNDHIEDSLRLPSGEYDVPIVIQDRKFLEDNQLNYGAIPWLGMFGDTILVNGRPNYNLSCATRVYRFRVLNGSNSRIYKLAWSDNTPLYVIGTDGGLLPRPVVKQYVMLAPGERVDLWVDLRRRSVGTILTLKSLEFYGATIGFWEPEPRNGAPFDIMTVTVDRREQDTSGSRLWQGYPFRGYSPGRASNRNNPRVFNITWDGALFGFNGRVFEMLGVAEEEKVRLNSLEIWEFVNDTGDQVIAHPIHLHGPQFQIIKRSVLPRFREGWESVRHGYINQGWHDTVLLMPGERAKILVKFAPYDGMYLYHCHNLEHEDMGMMRNYMIEH